MEEYRDVRVNGDVVPALVLGELEIEPKQQPRGCDKEGAHGDVLPCDVRVSKSRTSHGPLQIE